MAIPSIQTYSMPRVDELPESRVALDLASRAGPALVARPAGPLSRPPRP
ncbi:hypothetical protein [Sorangium sp. So ce590]